MRKILALLPITLCFTAVGNAGPSGNNRLNSLEFGKAGATFSPRNLQLGLKLRF